MISKFLNEIKNSLEINIDVPTAIATAKIRTTFVPTHKVFRSKTTNYVKRTD